MSRIEESFLAADWQESTWNLGGVLAEFVRRRFPRDTIKQVARALDCTLPAAANVTKGHASERTLTKAFQVWPWEFAQAAATAFSGRTYEQHLENQIEETRRVEETLARRRDRVRELEEIAASLVGLRGGLDA